MSGDGYSFGWRPDTGWQDFWPATPEAAEAEIKRELYQPTVCEGPAGSHGAQWDEGARGEPVEISMIIHRRA